MEIGSLPEKEFRVMIIEMIKDLGRRMDPQSKKLDVFKQREKVKKQLGGWKDTVIAMKKYTRRNQQ